MTKRPRAWLSALLFAGAMACGGSSAKQAGETCVASSECGDGLVCDFGQTPAVCASMGTIDAAELDADPSLIDAAELDAAQTDGPAPIDARVIDGATPIDAPMIDAPMIDAPLIDAELPIDAAPPIDAPIDAPPDA